MRHFAGPPRYAAVGRACRSRFSHTTIESKQRMKILDIPQSGKRGLTVSLKSRNGLVSRSLARPTDPRTDAQLRLRGLLGTVATHWSRLTQEQRDAWAAEASRHQSRPRLGQSGPLTGFQLYLKINCARLVIGEQEVPMPPPPPNFPELPVSGLTITNAGGGITLKLMTTDSLPEGTMLWGAAPCSQGRNTARRLVFLGTLSPPVGNAIDISRAYEARFGAPRVGSKVFVQVNQNLSGWEDLRGRFWATVPAAA